LLIGVGVDTRHQNLNLFLNFVLSLGPQIISQIFGISLLTLLATQLIATDNIVTKLHDLVNQVPFTPHLCRLITCKLLLLSIVIIIALAIVQTAHASDPPQQRFINISKPSIRL
jgi:hypothetical protein